MTDKQKSRANMTVDQVNLDRCICDIDLVASGRKDCEEIRKHIRAIRRIFAGLPEEPTKFDVGDTIRPKGSKAEYTITSISGGCYHGKGWGLPIDAEKDYELVESAEDVDAQINSQNEAIKQLNRALNSMERGGHLPLDEDRMKSLRPQNRWKPSDRELGAILTAIGDERQKGRDVAKELLNIYQQLKKLREE